MDGEQAVSRESTTATVILARDDVARLLPVRDCVDAVEQAFLQHARGETIPPSVLGIHVDGGGFHVKSAGLPGVAGGRPVVAVKINANFPRNPDRLGLPTIQGVIALFDAGNGRVLALLDSIEVTTLRTAAATAVAAKHLAPEAATVAVCGCGEQGRSQLRALACVRPFSRVDAIDTNGGRAERFATDMEAELGVTVRVVGSPNDAARHTNIWITCTPAHQWFLGRSHVRPGSFVAAAGADNPEKQEIEPALLAASVVVADLVEQCATIGDLHHAIAAGLMRKDDVRAELADVVAGTKPGRLKAEETIIFDSTGTALQDVAAAVMVYERALAAGAGLCVELGGLLSTASSTASSAA
ncbi:MAG TPA: ornithine cyclodeaminase family protein [Gemmatimonadaceae bacterium]|nr:ornithine cyclodeaminase family protein [Gemmatimonadaceae bacterium]